MRVSSISNYYQGVQPIKAAQTQKYLSHKVSFGRTSGRTFGGILGTGIGILAGLGITVLTGGAAAPLIAGMIGAAGGAIAGDAVTSKGDSNKDSDDIDDGGNPYMDTYS